MNIYDITIIFINTRSSNDRTSQISADIFNCNVRSTKVGFGTNIKTICMIFIDIILNLAERGPDGIRHFFKKNLAEGKAKEREIKMFDGTPGSKVAGSAFGDECMDVRIPFKITTKGMKNTDKSGSKIFGFIKFIEHAENNIPDRRKEKVQKRAILKKEASKFFRNSKDTVPVNTGNQFAGDMKRTELIVLVATSRTKAIVAAERNKL